MSCVPAVPGSSCVQTVYFVDGNGVKQQADISINLTGQFLKVLNFRKAGAGFNKEFKPGSEEYGDFMKDLAFQAQYRNKVSEVKGEVERAGGLQVRRARSAADVNGTTDVWDGTTAGGGYYNPAEDPGNATPQAAAEPNPNNEASKDTVDQSEITGQDASQSLSPLNYNRGSFFSGKYPLDANYDNSQDCVEIEMFEYRAPQEQQLFDQNRLISGSSAATTIFKGLRRNSNLRQSLGAVKLPIPNSLGDAQEVKWGDSKVNSLQAGAFFAGAGVVASALEGNFGEGLKKLGAGGLEFIKEIGAGGLQPGTDMNLIISGFITQQVLSKIGINVDANTLTTRATGSRINSNLELLFNSPTLRSFTLMFDFAPNSSNEASNVRKIQRFFKQGMSPQKNNERLLFIGSPNVFRVKYKNGSRDIEGLNAHKICALLQCKIDFTPDNIYQAYEDDKAASMPIASKMALTFQELTPIFNQDYQPGSNQQNGTETDPSVIDAGIAFTDESVGF